MLVPDITHPPLVRFLRMAVPARDRVSLQPAYRSISRGSPQAAELTLFDQVKDPRRRDLHDYVVRRSTVSPGHGPYRFMAGARRLSAAAVGSGAVRHGGVRVLPSPDVPIAGDKDLRAVGARDDRVGVRPAAIAGRPEQPAGGGAVCHGCVVPAGHEHLRPVRADRDGGRVGLPGGLVIALY